MQQKIQESGKSSMHFSLEISSEQLSTRILAEQCKFINDTKEKFQMNNLINL